MYICTCMHTSKSCSLPLGMGEPSALPTSKLRFTSPTAKVRERPVHQQPLTTADTMIQILLPTSALPSSKACFTTPKKNIYIQIYIFQIPLPTSALPLSKAYFTTKK